MEKNTETKGVPTNVAPRPPSILNPEPEKPNYAKLMVQDLIAYWTKELPKTNTHQGQDLIELYLAQLRKLLEVM